MKIYYCNIVAKIEISLLKEYKSCIKLAINNKVIHLLLFIDVL